MAAEHKEEWKQDALGYIEIWQEKTDPRGVADVSGPIARLYNACTTLYRDILVRIRTKDYISEINVRLLERSFSTLSFWGLDFDVSRGNLDRTLKHSHSLSRSTLKLLASIGKVLAMRTFSSSFVNLLLTIHRVGAIYLYPAGRGRRYYPEISNDGDYG